MSTIHNINYNILNQKNKNFIIDVYINDILLTSATHTKTEMNQSLIFEYDYKKSNNTDYSLMLVLHGEEQQHKEMKVKNILINNSIVDINNSYYLPEMNNFWNSLSANKYKQMKKKLSSHGGIFGWFGSIEYEYCVLHNTSKQHNFDNLISKTKIKI